MTLAIAVIGAGFGDEGKGLMTDYFARKFTKNGMAPLVARGNGGAQAGHTVVDGDRRHVFGHIGSGAFAGSPTYLGANFILNPAALENEVESYVETRAVLPRIFANRACRVTTIYDMAINSLAELSRDKSRGSRHGSCGFGINETVTRHQAGYRLTLDHIDNGGVEVLRGLLEKIRWEWSLKRLTELGCTYDQLKERLPADVFDKARIYYNMFGLDTGTLAEKMRRTVNNFISVASPHLPDPIQEMVIEGAQGLMLDEFLGVFPHVTRSVTGLPSSIAVAVERGYQTVQPIYVTRAYTTRHGNGPLKHEGVNITENTLVDLTNVHNEWQGTLRYAPLDGQELQKFISADYYRGQICAQVSGVQLGEPLLAITCLDQPGEFINVIDDGKVKTISTCNLPAWLERVTGFKVTVTSHGPTANDVKTRDIAL